MVTKLSSLAIQLYLAHNAFQINWSIQFVPQIQFIIHSKFRDYSQRELLCFTLSCLLLHPSLTNNNLQINIVHPEGYFANPFPARICEFQFSNIKLPANSKYNSERGRIDGDCCAALTVEMFYLKASNILIIILMNRKLNLRVCGLYHQQHWLHIIPTGLSQCVSYKWHFVFFLKHRLWI